MRPLIERVVNRIGDALVGTPLWVWRVGLYGLIAAVVLLFVTRNVHEARDEGAQAVRDSLSAVTAVRLHRQKDSVGERVVRQSVVVTRTVRHQDTLWAQLPEKIVTRAETVQVLNALPSLREAADGTAKACTDLLNTCAAFRLMADSLDLARQAQIAGLQQRVKALQPRKSQTVLKWAQIGAALYVGFKVGRSR